MAPARKHSTCASRDSDSRPADSRTRDLSLTDNQFWLEALELYYSEKLDPLGMVIDFTDIKRVVSGWIDQNLDHRMILHRKDPIVPVLQGLGEPLYLIDANPTAENIARLIYECAAGHGFPITEVKLWETPNCYATYRP